MVARQTLRYPYNIRQQCVLSPTTFMLSQQLRITTQRICRGAAQFLLCRNPTSRPPRRFALLFIPQTLITPQRMVGANSVRPPLFAYMVCTISNLATHRNGTSRAPSPTILHYFATPQNRSALCGFYVVQEDRKAVQISTPIQPCIRSQLCNSSFSPLHRL